MLVVELISSEERLFIGCKLLNAPLLIYGQIALERLLTRKEILVTPVTLVAYRSAV